MRGLFSHLRYTVRRLMKSPGFTVTATLILGLGIGANTAIFSLVNCVLVVSLFSGAALLLAAVGLYGVLSYSVSQRKRELGIRVAVGAQAWNIFRLVVTQGLLIGATGLIVGFAGALIFAHFIQAALYQVPSTDPPTLIAAAAVLWLTALMACLLPALRATRIDPIQALRE